MSIVSEVIARLQSGADPKFRIVAGAAEFSMLTKVPPALPAAYVMTLREVSGENDRMTGPTLQRMESDIGIAIAAGNRSDARGAAAMEGIEELKAWVRGRLIGFVPECAADPFEHVTGELLDAGNGVVWWQDTFGTASYLEETP
jgi:hypothetical protein